MSASDGPRRPQVDVVGKYSVSANTALEKRLLRCEVGLAVLAYWLGREIGGYVNVHLECRYLHRGGEGNHRKLRPEWSDIFLWAVLVGQPEIAGLLWTKTEDPLRMAVYASLFCKKIAADMPECTEKTELLSDAEMYETWAMDLLDEVSVSIRVS